MTKINNTKWFIISEKYNIVGHDVTALFLCEPYLQLPDFITAYRLMINQTIENLKDQGKFFDSVFLVPSVWLL